MKSYYTTSFIALLLLLLSACGSGSSDSSGSNAVAYRATSLTAEGHSNFSFTGAYDQSGNPTTVQYTSSGTVIVDTYTYNVTNDLIQWTNTIQSGGATFSNTTYQFTFDGASSITGSKEEQSGTASAFTTYAITLNADQRPLQVLSSNNLTASTSSFTYDDQGFLLSTTDGRTETYAYNVNSLLEQYTVSVGSADSTLTHQYDAQLRLQSTLRIVSSDFVLPTTSGSGIATRTNTYQYDVLGRLESVLSVEVIQVGAEVDTQTTTYSYGYETTDACPEQRMQPYDYIDRGRTLSFVNDILNKIKGTPYSNVCVQPAASTSDSG